MRKFTITYLEDDKVTEIYSVDTEQETLELAAEFAAAHIEGGCQYFSIEEIQ